MTKHKCIECKWLHDGYCIQKQRKRTKTDIELPGCSFNVKKAVRAHKARVKRQK